MLPDLPDARETMFGRIDEFRNAMIAGWAAEPGREGQPPMGALELEALHEGQVFSRCIANANRPDVAAAIGGDGRFGFWMRVPRRLLNGVSHAIEIRTVRDHRPIGDGSFTIQTTEAESDSGFATCRIDFASDPFSFLGDAQGQASVARNFGQLDVEDLGPLYSTNQVQRPAFAAERFSPRHPEFEAQVRGLYGAINATQSGITGSRIVKLRNVYAYNNRLHAITKDDDVVTIYETARPPDRPYTAQPNWTADQLRERSHTVVRPGPLLYMGSPGFVNYGHWLVDDLPRAEATKVIAAREKMRVTASVPGSGSRLDDVKNESLRLLYPDTMNGDILFVPADHLMHFPELYYVTPHTFHPTLKSPEACSGLRSLARSKLTAGSGYKRLHITRHSSHGRQIRNAADVDAALHSRGFQRLDPGGMSFTEQVEAFSNAGIVVGLMGAAMTNTLFSAVGTKLLYLCPSGWIEPFYWDLAAMCGHDYGVFYGDSEPGLTSEPHRSDFSVPVDELLSTLDTLEGAG